MATPKQAHTLTTYYGNKYKEKYGFEAKTNRYKARWGWDAILMDMSEKDTKSLVDYYFTTISPNGHDLDWFFYNYDKLAEAKEKSDADAKAQAVIRERTRRATEEWRKKNSGNN